MQTKNITMNHLKGTVNRKAPVLLFDVVAFGINSKDQKDVLDMPLGIDYYVSFNGEVFVLIEEYKRMERFFLEKYKKEDLMYLFSVLNRWKKIREETIQYCEKKDIQFPKLYQKLRELSTYLYIPIVAGDAYEKYLRQFNMDDVELQALCSPIRRNFESEEWRSFLGLVADPTERAIHEHVQLFGWMNAKYFERDPFTEEDVRTRIQSYRDDPKQKLHELNDLEESAEAIICEAVKKYQLSEEVVKFGREMIWLRNDRADATTRVGVLLFSYWSQIAHQHALEYSDILYMTLDEIWILIEHGTFPDISQRKRYYCYENIAGISSVSQKVRLSDEMDNVKSFEGSIAYKGVVRGKVRIVLQDTDVSKVREGDILVATMTLPSYVLGMQEAKAIVTDDGGITCHAAIIARELRKPCIIGTKIATKVLKDGDMVEVDADRGVVRILQRAGATKKEEKLKYE